MIRHRRLGYLLLIFYMAIQVTALPKRNNARDEFNIDIDIGKMTPSTEKIMDKPKGNFSVINVGNSFEVETKIGSAQSMSLDVLGNSIKSSGNSVRNKAVEVKSLKPGSRVNVGNTFQTEATILTGKRRGIFGDWGKAVNTGNAIGGVYFGGFEEGDADVENAESKVTKSVAKTGTT